MEFEILGFEIKESRIQYEESGIHSVKYALNCLTWEE